MVRQRVVSDPPGDIAAEFVDTYDPPSYANPWDAVVDYRRVQEYQAEHPDAGGTAVSSALELPRGRVRPWLGGSQPDVVRGYQAAQNRAWLPFDPDSSIGRGLTGLAGWIYAGGSIDSQWYVPMFAVAGETERDLVTHLADLTGVELTVSREGGDGRGEEYRPAEHGSVLGRVLSALGCPVGEKNPDSVVVLPGFLSDASDRTRVVFVKTYLDVRGTVETVDNHERVRLKEERSERYLRSLAHLFSEVLGADVWQHGQNVVLSHPATQAYRGLASL